MPGNPGIAHEGLHKIPGKAPDTRSLESKHARGAARAGTSVPPTGVARPGGTQLHGRARCHPPRLGDPGPEGAWPRGPPRGPPEVRCRVARRKDARGGAAVGEGPCRDSHSPPSSPPAGAPRRSPLQLSPRASPLETQRPARARGAGEKSVRAEGVWRVEPRGWGGRDGRSRRRRGHHRHGCRQLVSATEAMGPPTTPASQLPHRQLEE